METMIVYAKEQKEFEDVNNLFKDGWNLNPNLKNPLVTLESAIVYHLAKLTEAELEVLAAKEPKITSVKSIDINEADQYLQQGYEVHDFFAKTVTIIKRQKEEKKEPETS